MTLQSRTSRSLAAAAVSAVALGGAVVAASPAQAAPATNSYSCASPAGTFTVGVTTDVPMLPPTAPAGFDVPAEFLDVTNKVTIPKEAYDLFTGFGVTEMDMTDYRLTLGEQTVGATRLAVAPSAFTANPDGTYSADVNGKNAAFEAPAAGSYPATAPQAFKIVAKLESGAVDIACTATAAPTSIGNLEVVKNTPEVKVKVKKNGAKVVVKVKADNQDPTGKVVAKVNKKKLKGQIDENGKLVLAVKPKFLKPGNNKVKATYKGDDYTEKATEKTTFMVKAFVKA